MRSRSAASTASVPTGDYEDPYTAKCAAKELNVTIEVCAMTRFAMASSLPLVVLSVVPLSVGSNVFAACYVQGVSGAFCSPPCSASGTCPAPPAGTTAQAECALDVNGNPNPTYCALICTPGTTGSGGCPGKATCQPISGVGVCTYPAP
jgi:hypothetical protein